MIKKQDVEPLLSIQNVLNRKKIGEGAYSVVERGLFRSEPIVCKRLKGSMLSSGYRGAFDYEVEVLRKLPTNSFVVRFFGCQIYQDVGFIFLESCDFSLRTYLSKNSDGLSLRTAQLIFSQLCAGLQFLYNQDICHRDIKPENILLKENNGDLLVKYADFGSAVCFSEKKNAKALLAIFEECRMLMTPIYKPYELWDQGELDDFIQSTDYSCRESNLFRQAYVNCHKNPKYGYSLKMVSMLYNELWLLDEFGDSLRLQVRVMSSVIDLVQKVDVFSLGMTMLIVLSHWTGYKNAGQIVLGYLEHALGSLVDRSSGPINFMSRINPLFFHLKVNSRINSYQVQSPVTVIDMSM